MIYRFTFQNIGAFWEGLRGIPSFSYPSPFIPVGPVRKEKEKEKLRPLKGYAHCPIYLLQTSHWSEPGERWDWPYVTLDQYTSWQACLQLSFLHQACVLLCIHFLSIEICNPPPKALHGNLVEIPSWESWSCPDSQVSININDLWYINVMHTNKGSWGTTLNVALCISCANQNYYKYHSMTNESTNPLK